MSARPARTRPPALGGDHRASGLWALLGWTAFLVASIASLHAFGGPLAPPPLDDPGRFDGWLDQRQPAEAAVAVVRLLAIGFAWYLLAVTAAGTLARLAGVASLVRAADAVTLPPVRRLVSSARVSMTAAVFAFAGAAAGADQPTGWSGGSTTVETGRRLPGAATTGTSPPTAAQGEGASARGTSPPPTMRRLPDPVVRGSDPSATAPPEEMDAGAGAGGRPPTMRRLPDASAGDGTDSPGGAEPDSSGGTSPSAPTMRLLPDAPASEAPPSQPWGDEQTPPGRAAPSTTTTARPATRPSPSRPAPSPAATPPTSPGPASRPSTARAGDAGAPAPAAPTSAGARTWRVEPGYHFWSVAERVLAEVWQRGPTDAEVDCYWRDLVAANRAVLRDPDNPDLLFPGQVITVPAPPVPEA